MKSYARRLHRKFRLKTLDHMLGDQNAQGKLSLEKGTILTEWLDEKLGGMPEVCSIDPTVNHSVSVWD